MTNAADAGGGDNQNVSSMNPNMKDKEERDE